MSQQSLTNQQQIFNTGLETLATNETQPSPPAEAPLSNEFTSSGGDFTVNFTGFTEEAQNSFQLAVETWDAHLDLALPVTIDAFFEDLGGEDETGATTLGSVFPFGFETIPDDTLDQRLQAAIPLANQLLGEDTNGDEREFDIVFNSNPDTSFFFGPDEAISEGQRDFTSIVLHELAHGLGLTSSLFVDDDGLGRFDGPTIYDHFIEDGAGEQIIGLENGSTELADAITGGNLFYDGNNVDLEGFGIGGGNANEAFDGARPQVFAPDPHQPGASIAHLDEVAFNPGSGNALLTPTIDAFEIIREPGPIVLGMLEDIGYTLE